MIGFTYEVPAVLSQGRHWAKARIRETFHLIAQEQRFRWSRIKYTTGVDQEEGPVLIGTAQVVGYLPSESRFVDDLDSKDRKLLRARARAVFRKQGHELTDIECDAVINEIGPETALKELRKAIH